MGHPPQPTLIHPILLPQPFSSSPTAPAYSSIRHIIMKMLELRMRDAHGDVHGVEDDGIGCLVDMGKLEGLVLVFWSER